MKQTKTAAARSSPTQSQETPKRSQPTASVMAPSSGHIAQLAGMLNGSSRVQALAQLRDDIHQNSQLQNVMGLASKVNHDQPPAQRQTEAGEAESGLNSLIQAQFESTLAHSNRSGDSMAEDTGRQPAEQSSCGCSAQREIDPGSRSKEPAKGKTRTQRKRAPETASEARPAVAQLYRKISNFTAQQADSAPLFTTEAINPQLTYSRSWTELWRNKNYRVQYPTARPDPASVGLLAADDNSLAIHDTAQHPKEFYASPGVISASNTSLERVQSSVRLSSTGNSVTVSGQKLQKVEPQNVREPVEDDGTDFAEMMQHECYRMAGEVIGMQGNVQSEVAVGRSGAKRSIKISPDPEKDNTINSLTRTLARSGKKINPHSVVKGVESEKGLSEKDARTYGTRSGKGQLDETARTLGLNQFAEPEVGEAYAIFSNAAEATRKLDFSKLISGGRPTQRGNVWGYHFAGVVAQSSDGKDRITLENYSRAADAEKVSGPIRDAVLNKYRAQLGNVYNQLQGADRLTIVDVLFRAQQPITQKALDEYRRIRASSAPERRWFFQIYGTKTGQTFHEKQAASGEFVNPLTVRTQKPLADLKKDTVDQVDGWVRRVTDFKAKYKDKPESVLKGPDLAEAVEDFKGKVRSAHSQEVVGSLKLRVPGTVLDAMIEQARSLREREVEHFIGADKSFSEHLTDFSLRLDSAQLIKDIDSLLVGLAGLRNLC